MTCVNIQLVPIITAIQYTRKSNGFSNLHNDTMTENIPVWKSIVDRLKGPCYLNGDDHDCKIGVRKQRRDMGKYCFVNRTFKVGNQLPAEALTT
jgi:hypothetical protein